MKMEEREKKTLSFSVATVVIVGTLIFVLSAVCGYRLIAAQHFTWDGPQDVNSNPVMGLFENVSDILAS